MTCDHKNTVLKLVDGLPVWFYCRDCRLDLAWKGDR